MPKISKYLVIWQIHWQIQSSMWVFSQIAVHQMVPQIPNHKSFKQSEQSCFLVLFNKVIKSSWKFRIREYVWILWNHNLSSSNTLHTFRIFQMKNLNWVIVSDWQGCDEEMGNQFNLWRLQVDCQLRFQQSNQFLQIFV